MFCIFISMVATKKGEIGVKFGLLENLGKTMSRPVAARSGVSGVSGIPVFKLYGEHAAWPTPDLLHCESIPERSHLHDWEISLHCHADLGQLLYVQAGRAVLDVEGEIREIDQPAIQVVPPLSVHGFRFSHDIAGYVITLAMPLFDWLQDSLADAAPALLQTGCYPVEADKPYLDLLCERIDREYATPVPGRDFLLRSLIGALAGWIGRQQLERRAELWQPDRAQSHAMAFTRLVEQHYREHWSVGQYASALAITTAHLNNVCRRHFGQSALGHMHERLQLEAKRNLVYTTMTIMQIADLLGFSEVAYFSRFFRRLEGMSPREFRQQRQAAYAGEGASA
jgi:AraC family transcriptional regulator, transcriptional activator of pobA